MSETDTVVLTTPCAGLTLIAINRPSQRNAVNPETAQKLYDAFVNFENDPKARICVLSGTEGTFCAGADLHEAARNGIDHLMPVQDHNIGPMGPSRLQISKPVICAVSGHAVAGGLELSLLGDLRIVEEDAVLGVYCRRWGVPLIDGGTVRLPALIGLGRALDMILTGRPVRAQEALMFGLANRVVPKGKALEEAIKMAKQLLLFPQKCMNIDRRSTYYSVYNASSFQDALKFEFDHGIEALTEEGLSGAARFSGGIGRHGDFNKI